MAQHRERDQIDVLVGRRVRMRRLAFGWSMERLAGGLGLTFQQVQKYENGRNRISASRLHAIARLLGTTPAFFFDDPLVGGEERDTVEFLATAQELELNRAFAKIGNATVRRKVIEFVEAVARARRTSGKSAPP
jgi:transcriptional regulator with XRE-family HTH domain